MKLLPMILCAGVAAFFCGCETTVEQPKGTSKGFSSVRLVRPDPKTAPDFMEDSDKINRMIQNSMASQFRANGLEVRESDADLVVAYLLIIQNNASTAMIDDYFGHGRSSWDIQQLAHDRGVVKSDRPDYFEAGAIVVDLIDARTNKLVFRNYAKRDLADEGISDSARQARINDAVAEALRPFFR